MVNPQIAPYLPKSNLSKNPENCRCPMQERITNIPKEKLNRNEYLRENVMEPLAWAISRALQYKPTDPKYYMVYQLLKWKYINNANEDLGQWRFGTSSLKKPRNCVDFEI